MSRRSNARDPNATSTSPAAIGSINFGVSSIGVEKSASENKPIGLVAASKPWRTAAPLPRFGECSINRVVIEPGAAKTSRTISDVASLEPSFTTISSLSGLVV